MIRRGMTLVEMLVALVATLMLMTAIAQAFSAFGGAISDSRAVLDLDGRMRIAAWRLRSDLAGVTARTLPPLGPDGGEGYFEIIEGPASDADAANGKDVCPADHDDVLLFTTRNTETPFIGRAPGGASLLGQTSTLESSVAEVGWFARPTTPGASNPTTYTLYRKQLLVMGYVGTDPFHSAPGGYNTIPVPAAPVIPPLASGALWSSYFNLPCDVSARVEVSLAGTALFPNTLADLSRREARFMHNGSGVTAAAGFPFRFVDHQAVTAPDGLIFDSTSQRQGEDVVLTNVIAFDVRVFDPGAPVHVTAGNTPLVPGDPLFNSPASGSGAFVDLGYDPSVPSRFSGFGQAKSGLMGSRTDRRTYDTWSLHYEADGRDQGNANGIPANTIDEGTNGLDDDADGDHDEPAYDANGDGVFEDPGETETLPPYPVPLRGIEVRIRCYEPTSRQVRQVTIRHSFR